MNTLTNHEAEREGANYRKRERNSRELNVAEMADEDVGDGVDGELAHSVENDRQRNLPQFHGFSTEHIRRRPELRHRSVVTVLCYLRRRRVGGVEQRSVRVHVWGRRSFGT